VYSTAESLLVRKITLPLVLSDVGSEVVIAMRISGVSPNLLWVASSKGRIWKLDWTNGDGAGEPIHLKCKAMKDMAVEAVRIEDKLQDVVYAAMQLDNKWCLYALGLRDGKVTTTEISTTQKQPIYNLQSLSGGVSLAASSGQNLLISVLQTAKRTTFADLRYDTYTLNCADEITCLDLRNSERYHLTEQSRATKGDLAVLDVAVGCARGAIYIYQDILSALEGYGAIGRATSQDYQLQPQKHHWHRKAVHAVKWSRDGLFSALSSHILGCRLPEL
jgi:NET1-associated nuclear protein 1 (U3 small nucleolar RNA-associated protein 17)